MPLAFTTKSTFSRRLNASHSLLRSLLSVFPPRSTNLLSRSPQYSGEFTQYVPYSNPSFTPAGTSPGPSLLYPGSPVSAANDSAVTATYASGGASRNSTPVHAVMPESSRLSTSRTNSPTVSRSQRASRRSCGVLAGMGRTCAPAHMDA